MLKKPLHWERFFGARKGHWPPVILWPAGVLPDLLQTSPAGSSLSRAASLAVALAGHLLFLAGRSSEAAGTSLAL
jgi:hypothetical protein